MRRPASCSVLTAVEKLGDVLALFGLEETGGTTHVGADVHGDRGHEQLIAERRGIRAAVLFADVPADLVARLRRCAVTVRTGLGRGGLPEDALGHQPAEEVGQLAVRRLPYALRSCIAALQQVHTSLEEAAESLGATKLRTIRRVMVPLMAGGILAGFVTSFVTAAVELSATILLTSSQSQAPMSYGIYLYMQSIAGRGPGAALGVLAIAVVALGTYASHLIVERTGTLRRAGPAGDATPDARPPTAGKATARA